MKYYPKKEEAQRALNTSGARLTAVQFEPGKGFVAVIVADKADHGFDESIYDVQYPNKPRPVPKFLPPKTLEVVQPTLLPAVPGKGVTRRVWQIADANPGKSRKEVIAICVAEGIHPSTASVQFGKWSKKST